MFDLSRIGEALSGLASSITSAGGEQADLMSALQNAGLDPSVLSGLSEPEVTALLESFGIDATQFAEGQIGEILQGLGFDAAQAGDIISAPWGDSFGRG